MPGLLCGKGGGFPPSPPRLAWGARVGGLLCKRAPPAGPGQARGQQQSCPAPRGCLPGASGPGPGRERASRATWRPARGREGAAPGGRRSWGRPQPLSPAGPCAARTAPPAGAGAAFHTHPGGAWRGEAVRQGGSRCPAPG